MAPHTTYSTEAGFAELSPREPIGDKNRMASIDSRLRGNRWAIHKNSVKRTVGRPVLRRTQVLLARQAVYFAARGEQLRGELHNLTVVTICKVHDAVTSFYNYLTGKAFPS